MLPGTVGADPLSLSVIRGQDAEPMLTSAGRKLLRRVLKAQGKTMKDLQFIQGSYGQSLALQGVRIEGGDATPVATFLVDQLRTIGLLDKGDQPAPAEVGGKQVGTVPYGDNTIFLYTSGDTAWAITAVEASAGAELLEALP
jgi:hypothetical protein